MQLNVFSTDSQKSGFRLQYMEVLNWGTFDEYIYSIQPGGETSLLTGSNASGKTTFVDALLTLIVPEKRYRFYNQSSGSERKGDRTEDSYVMGGYATMNSESTGATKTLYLRDSRDQAYSILLAAFHNEADQAVTVFQVRYYSNGEMRRVFGVALKPLHIEEDFRPFDLGGNWKRRLEQQYNKGPRKQIEWFDSAARYAQKLVEALGMQSIQALHLFNQTVGIKVLGNLDEFIRTHMLEPRNIEEQFQDLRRHLGTLLDAQRNIEKVEEQIRLLEPVEQHFDKFKALQRQQQEAIQNLETATAWQGYTRDRLLVEAIAGSKDRLRNISSTLEEKKKAITEWLEKERVLQNQIDNNKVGQRIRELEKEIADYKDRKQAAERNLDELKSWCQTLKLEETDFPDEPSYNRSRKEASRRGLTLEREQRLNEENEFDYTTLKKNSESEQKTLEIELNNLLQHKNNIPAYLTQLRQEICNAVELNPSDLPFAGELMQVKAGCRDWRPALEKLLHGFARRLLVPNEHYKRITKYINSTNIRNRIVYHQVRDLALRKHPEENTVVGKLDFHPDNPMADWVEQQVILQFSHICLDDERTIERYEKAITLNGLIKNADRHEKDDRPQATDPRNYVMGWNNEEKKEALISRRNVLTDDISRAVEGLARCKKKSDGLQRQFYALQRLNEHGGFSMIDINSLLRWQRRAEEQVAALRDQDNEFNTLRLQLDDTRDQRTAEEQARDRFNGDRALLENQLAGWENDRLTLQPLIGQLNLDDKEQILEFQQRHSQNLAEVTLDNLTYIYQSLREQFTAGIETFKENMHKEDSQLSRCINRIRNPSADILQRFPDWLGDVETLPEDPVHAGEYLEWLTKLTTDNLPRYRTEFENYINATITYKIGGLNEEMEKWEREIRGHVQRLNASLAGINFNRLPDTYIQLGARPVPDSTIKEFRGRLLDALPQAANWQQSTYSEKALHFRQKVQPLIASLEANEDYRSRVMDVRNWFEFWADEKYKETDELKKTYRQMGQLSGGEKAQLTYTILCSAIAYQFGITREGKNSKSLRFIAVDESFSNQDEERATYLMELCKQLHLQLLVVTPSDKIQIVQDFIAHVHLVQRVNNRHSVIFNMTIKELQEKMQTSEVTV